MKFSADERAQNMIGFTTSNEVEEIGGGVLYKLGGENKADNVKTLDVSKIKSFGCSSNCTFIIYESP